MSEKLFDVCADARAMWDYEENTVDPNNVLSQSSMMASWKCDRNHKFKMKVRNFVNAKGIVCSECRRLSTTVSGKPAMMKFWDFSKNSQDVTKTSAKSDEVVWWKCPKCGYAWEAQIRTRKSELCPCCDTGLKIAEGINDVFTVVPELKKDYDPNLNPDIDVSSLGVGSHERINWKCHVCGTQWVGPIYRRIRYQDDGTIAVGKCPVCAGNRRSVSFAEEYPELVPLFSTKNAYKLADVKGNHSIKHLWECRIHGTFEANIWSIIRSIKSGNNGCPYCHGTKVKEEDSLGARFPEIASEWSPRNKKTPYEVSPGSGDTDEWICSKGHTWTAPIHTRTQGYGFCRECFPFGKSNTGFAQRFPKMRKYYSKDNTISFDRLIISDDEKRKWICEKGHAFLESTININQRGSFSCPICNHRTIISGVNDFYTEYPEYAKDYDSTNTIPVNMVSPISSDPSTLFKCSQGHVFQRAIRNHIISKGVCPICTKKTLSVGDNDLLTAYPKLEKIWDYEKNKSKPEEHFQNEYKYYHWICESGHSYYASVKAVVESNYVCPACSNKLVYKGCNDLATKNPELAAEWSCNNDKKASEVLETSSYVAKWMCPTCGGEYLKEVRGRNVGDDSCPYCKGERVLSGFNDLATTNPDLAVEWSVNNDKNASNVMKSSSCDAKWICPTCNGEYYAKIKERKVEDDSCPYCKGDRILIGYNDLATTNPQLAKQWSPNNEKKATDVMGTSPSYAKWICPTCKGEYSARIKDREVVDDSCPYCKGIHILKGFNDLETVDPNLATEWSPNNEKKATDVMRSSSNYYKWICPTCSGEYTAKVNEREVGDEFCPYCSGNRVLPGFNDLATTNPELAAEWLDSNSRKASEISGGITKGGWWRCSVCGGTYWSKIIDRTQNKNKCPYCDGKWVLPGFNDFATTNPDLLTEWSENNTVLPSEVMKHHFVMAKWRCPKCGGEYTYNLRDRELGDNSCPYCKGDRILPGFNDLATKNPELASEWSCTNDKTASEVMETSSYVAKWICPTCNGEYYARVSERKKGDKLCPYCKNERVLAGYNDLATRNPELAAEWSCNNDKTASEVMETSSYVAKWICPTCNGEYSTRVWERKKGDRHCPYCNGNRALIGVNDLVTTNPNLAAEWSCNNDKTASEVMENSSYVAKWICPTCKGEYNAKVSERSVGDDSCPYCRGTKVSPGYNSVDVRYPQILNDYAEIDNYLMGIDIQTFSENSNTKVWFQCKECGKKYLLPINEKVMKLKRGHDSCPFCDGRRRKLFHFV